MNKVHKIKLYPTKSQETFFKKSCGVARFAYNWALAKCQEDYKNGIKGVSAYDLIKHLTSIKKTEFPWMYEVGKSAPQYAIHNLETAYNKMWKEKKGYPIFKKKGTKDSFVAVENKENFKQKNHKIWIPKMGFIKCAENLRFEGKVNNVVVKRTATTWFAYINIETPESIPTLKQTTGENQAIVGIDLGIKTMITLSDGMTYNNPGTLKRNMRRLKIRNRRMSKKQKGGSNYHKAQTALSKHHYKISRTRTTTIHQMTTAILKKYDKVIIENLDTMSMRKHKGIGKQLADVPFGEIKRQFKYKAEWMGKELVLADRYFPSSKTCSGCGAIKEKLKLSERTYNCDNCGLKMDRDLNAAKNLAAYRPTAKYAESHAFGGRSSSSEITKSLPMNEEVELNHNLNLQT